MPIIITQWKRNGYRNESLWDSINLMMQLFKKERVYNNIIDMKIIICKITIKNNYVKGRAYLNNILATWCK